MTAASETGFSTAVADVSDSLQELSSRVLLAAEKTLAHEVLKHVPRVLPASLEAAAAADGSGCARPLNIAHRGFRARWPENSLAAFRHALAPAAEGGGGVEALETDVHLTRDGEVVLSHDPTLRRCFGRPERLADCDWSFLAAQRSTQAPGEPLARLSDLLALLSEPAHAEIWVLLDVKRDDDPHVLLRRVAETIEAVPGDWSRRIVLGCWEAIAIRICRERLPAFPTAYIGFSLSAAESLLRHHPDAVQVFNLNQSLLMGPRGARFQRDVLRTGRHRILVWTVNDPEWMEWGIRRRFNGIISDNPALFAEVRGDDDDTAKRDKPGPYPHPPSATSFTGLYLRRWASLLAAIGKLKAIAFVFSSIWWLHNGSWKSQLQKALGD